MADISDPNRGASFVCTIAYVSETEELSFTGVWPGRLATEASGQNGFGYDPVFIPEGFEVSAADLDPEVKNALSHRFMALSQMSSYFSG
jgi:XTP/dITP diphosphohydrolase